MNQQNAIETGAPKDPVSHPEVPDSTNPTEPEGAHDPPPAPEEPYPVTDLPSESGTGPAPVEDPVPLFPEPIPGTPTDIHFKQEPM